MTLQCIPIFLSRIREYERSRDRGDISELTSLSEYSNNKAFLVQLASKVADRSKEVPRHEHESVLQTCYICVSNTGIHNIRGVRSVLKFNRKVVVVVVVV